jgi:hypothetical protein
MKCRRIRAGIGGQCIQGRIDQALPRRTLFLIDDREHARKDRRSEAGSSGNGQVLLIVTIAEAA